MKYLLLLIASLSLATQFNFKDVRCDKNIVISTIEIYFDRVKGYTVLIDGKVVKDLIVVRCANGTYTIQHIKDIKWFHLLDTIQKL